MTLAATDSFSATVSASPDVVSAVAYFSNQNNPSLSLDFTTDSYSLADFASTLGTLEAS